MSEKMPSVEVMADRFRSDPSHPAICKLMRARDEAQFRAGVVAGLEVGAKECWEAADGATRRIRAIDPASVKE